METYSYSTSNNLVSSPSSYSNSSNSSSAQFQQGKRSGKPPLAYRSALHSVRKFPLKNIISKQPIAPMPPTPPKIYKVNPADFRDVVQRLTSGQDFQPTRLKEVAPPQLSLNPPYPLPVVHPSVKTGKSTFDSNSGALSPLGFSLSPSSLAWCSSILLSPGSLSSL